MSIDEPAITIRIRLNDKEDIDWMVKRDEVTFNHTLELLKQIMPQISHNGFDYEDEDGDKITVQSESEMESMFECYFSELSNEDKARGLLPPLLIYPKSGRTPQKRNIHDLKIQTGKQTSKENQTQQQSKHLPKQSGFETLISNGQITRESLNNVELLGKGNGGMVYKALHTSGKVMAVKEIKLDISVVIQKQIISELEILHTCNSQTIISFFGAFFFENTICICTEFMDGGSLDRYMPVSEIVLGQISLSVIQALHYIWNKNILHRDIKPSNILIDRSGQIKLCDFGVSTQLVKSVASTFLGTNVYLSPERVRGENYSTPAEVWSLGVTLFELATGNLPFASLNKTKDLSPLQIMSIILEEDHLCLPQEHFSLELIDFINGCLNKAEGLRISGHKLRLHQFIQKQGFDPGVICNMIQGR